MRSMVISNALPRMGFLQLRDCGVHRSGGDTPSDARARDERAVERHAEPGAKLARVADGAPHTGQGRA